MINYRNVIFWGLDLLKKGNIKRNVNEISFYFNNSKEYIKNKKSEEKVDLILKHAIKSVPFYKNKSEKDTIRDFPVVNKNTIKKNLSNFRSIFYQDETRLYPMITSGSTGTPFKIFHDKGKRDRNIADTIYFARSAGYILGEPLYYFKIWSDYNRKSSIVQKMQNIIPIDVLNLEENVSTVAEKIANISRPTHFLGYVSALETICKFLEVNTSGIKPLSQNISSVITMSESLDESSKRLCEKHFGCPVLSRYSNIENGIIAQQTLKSPNIFLINTASYYVEIFDLDKDITVPNGQLGRIVVTDLYNLATPLIRYDTGDTGIIEEREVAGKKDLYMIKIEGRKLDQLYDANGHLLSSYIIYKNMWKYTEIDQYQLVQIGLGQFIFKICSSGFERENQLKKELFEYLGKNSKITIEYVDEIPLLASGKRKKVVNLMQHSSSNV